MGCDIHVRIQVNDECHGWRSVGVPNDDRWYSFFEMLCGVRASNGFVGVMPRRGLPDKLGIGSGYGEESRHSFGDHSQTWFTLAEMKDALLEAEAFEDKTIPKCWRDTAIDRYKQWVSCGEVLGKAHGAGSDDDVRFVVGFDS